jgi:hypothetical protein
MGWLVGAVGIEPLATLKTRKLLSSLNAKKRQKNTEFAQLRYMAGTRATPAEEFEEDGMMV